MRPVTSRFLSALRGSHRISVRARVVEQFQTGTDPTGTEINVEGGDVESDAKVIGEREVRGAVVRSSADLATTGVRMWPYAASDLLAPFGNEIYLERGIAFGNGIFEWVGLGYFRIETVDQDEAPDGQIRITAKDRMAAIEDARFTEPQQFVQGQTLGTIVTELVTDVFPDAVIEWDDDTDLSTLGRSQVFEKDRFGALTDLTTSAGKMVFWDHRGVLVIQDIPDPGTPVYSVNAGEEGVLVTMSRDLSREGVYNAVVAAGEAADSQPPVTAIAIDNNEDSPTFFGGRFGRVPRFYASPFITNVTQAQSAAHAILIQSIGLPYNVDFGTVPNPALEPLDPVEVVYPKTSRSPSMRKETHILQTIKYPLAPESAMTAVTREQELTTVGFLNE